MNGKKIIRNIKSKKIMFIWIKECSIENLKKHTLSKDHKERNITKS